MKIILFYYNSYENKAVDVHLTHENDLEKHIQNIIFFTCSEYCTFFIHIYKYDFKVLVTNALLSVFLCVFVFMYYIALVVYFDLLKDRSSLEVYRKNEDLLFEKIVYLLNNNNNNNKNTKTNSKGYLSLLDMNFIYADKVLYDVLNMKMFISENLNVKPKTCFSPNKKKETVSNSTGQGQGLSRTSILKNKTNYDNMNISFINNKELFHIKFLKTLKTKEGLSLYDILMNLEMLFIRNINEDYLTYIQSKLINEKEEKNKSRTMSYDNVQLKNKFCSQITFREIEYLTSSSVNRINSNDLLLDNIKIENNDYVDLYEKYIGEFFDDEKNVYFNIKIRLSKIKKSHIDSSDLNDDLSRKYYEKERDFFIFTEVFFENITKIIEIEKQIVSNSKEFGANISKTAHEFKTPINTIISLSDSLINKLNSICKFQNNNNSDGSSLNRDTSNLKFKNNLVTNSNQINTSNLKETTSLNNNNNINNHNLYEISDEIKLIKAICSYTSFLICDFIHSAQNKELEIEIRPVRLFKVLQFCQMVTNALIKSLGHDNVTCNLLFMKKNIDNNDILYKRIKKFENIYTFKSDEVRLKQLLLNFLSNSVKFTKFGSINIDVDFEYLDEIENDSYNNIIITISDTGMGLSEDQLDKIRHRRSNELVVNRIINSMGTSLGLSICHSILENLNYEMTINSKINEGTTIKINLKNSLSKREPNMKTGNLLSSDDSYIIELKPILNSKFMQDSKMSKTNLTQNELKRDSLNYHKIISNKSLLLKNPVQYNNNSNNVNKNKYYEPITEKFSVISENILNNHNKSKSPVKTYKKSNSYQLKINDEVIEVNKSPKIKTHKTYNPNKKIENNDNNTFKSLFSERKEKNNSSITSSIIDTPTKNNQISSNSKISHKSNIIKVNNKDNKSSKAKEKRFTTPGIKLQNSTEKYLSYSNLVINQEEKPENNIALTNKKDVSLVNTSNNSINKETTTLKKSIADSLFIKLNSKRKNKIIPSKKSEELIIFEDSSKLEKNKTDYRIDTDIEDMMVRLKKYKSEKFYNPKKLNINYSCILKKSASNNNSKHTNHHFYSNRSKNNQHITSHNTKSLSKSNTSKSTISPDEYLMSSNVVNFMLKINQDKSISNDSDFISKDKQQKQSNQILQMKNIILIADDQKIIRNELKNKFIKANFNFDYVLCSDGVEILNNIIQDQNNGNKIKCIFTDESMTYMNGSEALKILKIYESERKIKYTPKVVCITSYDDKDTINSLISTGFDLVIMKNPSINYLKKIMNKLNLI